MNDYDARDYLGSSFLKKQDLRADGPRRLTIRGVEQSETLKDKQGTPRLVLVFDDDLRWTLSTIVNIKRLVEAFGSRTSGWIGKTFEAYYSPDVRGPGGEEGGIRIRVPERPAPQTPISPDVQELVNEL